MHLILAGAKLQPSGLVVCGNHDEGLVRMQCLKCKHDVDCGREVRDFLEAGGAVVGVSAGVDPAAFDHKEEAFVAVTGVKILDAGLDEVGQGGVALLAVNGIGEFGLSLAAEAEDPSGYVLYTLELFRAPQYLDPCSAGFGLEERGVVAGVALGDETCAGGEVYGGVEILECDLFIVSALGGMGDEAGRCGVVHTHAGGYTGAVSGFLSPFHEVRYGIAVHIDSYGVVVGLDSRGKGSASRSRISHERGCRYRGDEVPDREVGEIDFLRAVSCACIVLLSANHLVDAHPVADHVEDVFHLRGIISLPLVSARVGRDEYEEQQDAQ